MAESSRAATFSSVTRGATGPGRCCGTETDPPLDPLPRTGRTPSEGPPPPEAAPSCVTGSSPAPSRFASRPAVPEPRGVAVIQAGPHAVLLLRSVVPTGPTGPARPTRCTPTFSGIFRSPRCADPAISARSSIAECASAVVGMKLSVAQDWLKIGEPVWSIPKCALAASDLAGEANSQLIEGDRSGRTRSLRWGARPRRRNRRESRNPSEWTGA
jgi:hypothetical protein